VRKTFLDISVLISNRDHDDEQVPGASMVLSPTRANQPRGWDAKPRVFRDSRATEKEKA